ncbi:NUDIX domain-containing protein [Halomicrobium zhouii]|uniref:NUDIX domain-containing protein n=1 Tax=Halomicrobium zhouii TaxID=767519 RepID=A0A1I6LJB4_9EURY|nr:NUDIX domain-containing protein [Halomicrobium zhouii]SFS03420.1 NUDIX domain-containing protein [Halomicrobium zhouii]
MPEEVNRETVERRRDRLLDEYGEVRITEEREIVDAEKFPQLRALSRDGYTGGAYAWVVRRPEQAAALTESMPDEVNEGAAVLMILGRGGERWGLAGGGREDCETYEEAAVREVHEETGVDCDLTDLFLIRHRVATSDGDHGERLHTLSVFFDAEYSGGHVEIQPGELNGAAWFERPPARLYPENAYRAAAFWDDFETDGDPLAEYGE